MQENNNLNTLYGIYSSSPIKQSTDNLTNQTSYVINLMNAFDLKQDVEIGSLVDVKCKYCKGFYFPETQGENKVSVKRVKGLLNQEENSFICGLCGAVNQTKLQSIASKFARFQTLQQPTKFNLKNSRFTSVIVSQQNPPSSHNKSLPSTNPTTSCNNQIYFVFYIDLMSISQSIKQTVIQYVKTVIKEYFSSYTESTKSNPEVDFNQQEQQNEKHLGNQEQKYNIIIFLNINDQLHVANINTMATINIDFLVREKILSTISTENTPQMYEKEAQRKYSLVELITSCGIDLSKQEDSIEQYLEMVLEECNENEIGHHHGVNSSNHFNNVMDLLSTDKDPSRSYVTVWMGQVPLLNYQPHRVKKSNIHSIVYLFHQPSTQPPNINKQSSTQSTSQFQHNNIRNQLMLIKDNNQVYFVPCTEQGVQEFYYKLYELFSIVDFPKLFRARWSIKCDSRYPPLLTNDFPSFFIRPSSILLFIVSALVSTGNLNSKFQVSVVYEDWNRQEKLWIVNWTKDMQKETRQLNQIKHINQHKQNHQTLSSCLISKLPQLYNYICTLSRFALSMCIRGKNDIASHHQKRPLFSTNTSTSHHLCVLFQSIINRGTFKVGTTQITISYIESMYDYCMGVKTIPYEVLRFMANCQTNIKKAAEMVFPLLVRNQTEENLCCVVYWGEGYFCINDHSQDQNSQDQDWYAQFIDAANLSQGKYYTRRYQYQKHIHSDQNQLLKFYLKRLDQDKTTPNHYLPIQFTAIKQ